jgi:hypothetical protein
MLNNLFNAYAPKGTPPAAKDIIDSLPTVTVTEQEQCMVSAQFKAIFNKQTSNGPYPQVNG